MLQMKFGDMCVISAHSDKSEISAAAIISATVRLSTARRAGVTITATTAACARFYWCVCTSTSGSKVILIVRKFVIVQIGALHILSAANVLSADRIIPAVGEHIVTEHPLAGGDEGIGIEESTDCGIVITGQQNHPHGLWRKKHVIFYYYSPVPLAFS